MHEAQGEGYSFKEAQAYCRGLGEGWRTLSIDELFALRGDPAYTGGRSFWSSNSVVTGPSRSSTGSEGDAVRHGSTHGYSFYLQDGDVTITPVTKNAGVICTDSVRQKNERKYVKGEQGIIDSYNGILWQPLDATDKKEKFTFEAGQERCESLTLYERDWRLPTLDELYSIVSYARTSPSVDTSVFGIMMSRYYWSDDAFSEEQAYVVGFKLGSVATSDKKNRSYIRCVSDIDQ